MRLRFGFLLAALLSGCTALTPLLDSGAPVVTPQARPQGPVEPGPIKIETVNFAAVMRRIEPVAEQRCRQRTPGANCDFRIFIDARPDLPPNAYQTLDENGRPLIGFTTALIAQMRNNDELAFVMGHEAAHHIAGHLARTRETALAGTILGGLLAALAGADPASVEIAQDLGGTVGARAYSKEFELQADRLGTRIAYDAGYDPLIGVLFFNRIPDPGDRFLGTHPPNRARIDAVRQTVAGLG